METPSTVANSNQPVSSSSGVGELLYSCESVCKISDHVIKYTIKKSCDLACIE